MLNDIQRKRLLEIARASISNFLKTGRETDFKETDPALNEAKGVFVTLTKEGQLQGCIGLIRATTPIYQTVAAMAIEAAANDPRFDGIKPEELDNIKIEISLLSELRLIKDPAEIEVGRHGIMIRKGFYSGLLLPQVATECGWGREMFLRQACCKAGLGSDAWKEGAQIYIFEAEVFGEKGHSCQ